MKKLNKKGFTLVELLAVIVILAVIMVITIPTVLGSMSDAKKSAFGSAIKTIDQYLETQLANCKLGDTTLAPYDTTVATGSGASCAISTSATTTILTNTGYTNDIENLVISGSKVSSAEGKGQFDGWKYASGVVSAG